MVFLFIRHLCIDLGSYCAPCESFLLRVLSPHKLRVGSMIPFWMLRSDLPKGHSILLISMQLTSQAIIRFEQDRKKNLICALHIIVVV